MLAVTEVTLIRSLGTAVAKGGARLFARNVANSSVDHAVKSVAQKAAENIPPSGATNGLGNQITGPVRTEFVVEPISHHGIEYYLIFENRVSPGCEPLPVSLYDSVNRATSPWAKPGGGSSYAPDTHLIVNFTNRCQSYAVSFVIDLNEQIFTGDFGRDTNSTARSAYLAEF